MSDSSSSLPLPVALPVIPRYRLERPAVLFNDDGSMAVRPVDDPTGAWVRAEDASQLESRIAELSEDLRLNAGMLARQCDLAREAEAARLLAEQQRDALQARIAELEKAVTLVVD